MKVKPVIPGAIIRDPITMIPLPAEGGEVSDTGDAGRFWVRRWLDGSVWRREGDAWTRRLSNGDVDRQLAEGAAPTGLEPVAPLTTR